MKKHKFAGTGVVLRYTLQQHYKTLSVRIMLAIFLVISLAVFPVIMLMHRGKSQVETTQIKTLYLRNESGLAVSADDVKADLRYTALTVTETAEDNQALAEKLGSEKNAAAAVISADQSLGFVIKGYYAPDSDVTEADLSTLTDVLEEALKEARMRALGVTKEQTDLLVAKSSIMVQRADEFKSGADQIDPATHSFVNMAYSYMVLILITLSMSYIFQLCMEEKVSKLVESLLVSVEPAALLAGKILAVTCFLFAGIAMIVVGLIISWNIAKTLGDTAFIKDAIIRNLAFDPSALHIGFGTILMLAVSVLLAYGTGAFFSGICGSLCSKTEDTQQASIAVVLFVMVGYMAATMAPMLQNDSANTFLSVFPLTSIFIALPNYVCGKIGLPVFLIALAVQALTVILMALIAGRVYRLMLLYRGGIPSPKKIIAMLKDARETEKRAAGKEASHGNEA